MPRANIVGGTGVEVQHGVVEDSGSDPHAVADGSLPPQVAVVRQPPVQAGHVAGRRRSGPGACRDWS